MPQPVPNAKNPPFRADQVGSLVRPASIVAARNDLAAGKIDAAGLRAVEDAAIRDVVARQEAIGLRVVTDGEFRRNTYSDSFTTAGIAGVKVELTEEEGWKKSDTHGHRTARRIPAVVSRIEWRAAQNAKDFAALKSAVTKSTPKITLPGPAYIHYRAGRANIDAKIYPSLDEFWADLVKAYHQELASLFAAGCRYLQIDETNLPFLCDPKLRDTVKNIGEDPEKLPGLYVRMLNDVVKGKPADLTICMHMCRGNHESAWVAEGGYDPVAEQVFGGLDLDGFFLEYDSPRAGSFAPLRYLNGKKVAVLGLVTTKKAQIETKDELKRRIDEASRFVPLDRLALSPQCGFASTIGGNKLTVDDEKRKLALVVEVAREVWGTA